MRNPVIHKVQWTPEEIRDRLVAIAIKNHGHLRGLNKVAAVIREKHSRYHTIHVKPKHVRQAQTGSCVTCAYAVASWDVPGIYATVILRRVSYTLEKDENAEWGIYKFGTPDLARQRLVTFDRTRKMIEHVMNFKPLPASRRAAAARAAVKRSQRKHGRNPNPRPTPYWQLLRVSRSGDFA